MQLSETIKLYLSKEQRLLIVQTMNEYISTVNGLVSDAVNGGSINKYTSKDVKANLPSALSNQCIRDAKSIIRKYNKEMYKTEETNKRLKKTRENGIFKRAFRSDIKKALLLYQQPKLQGKG